MKTGMQTMGRWVAGLMILSVSSTTFAATPLNFDALNGALDRTTAPKQMLVVTPDNLDSVLMAGNTDIAIAMNNVAKARDAVAIARADLLPSLRIDLGYNKGSLFGIQGVLCLVPFLFPANWFSYYAAKQMSGAQAEGLHVTHLNAYAAAYNVLVTVSGDQNLVAVKEESYRRLADYVGQLKTQFELGLIPESEKLRAEMELGRAKVETLKGRELVEAELSHVREMLGLSLDQPFVLSMGEVPASQFEAMEATTLLDEVMQRAPERRQMDLLIGAAGSQVRAAQWAFLSGCGGGVTYSHSHDGGSSNGWGATAGVSLNIGFGYFPKVDLARRDVQELQIRKNQLALDMGQQVEYTLSTMDEIRGREEASASNVGIGEKMLKEQQQLFETGRASVRDILDTLNGISDAKLSASVARSDLAGHRITLQRLTLEDRFLTVLVNSHKMLTQ